MEVKLGMTFVGLFFFAIFMTLKLIGYIQWGWWYVSLPIIGGLVIDICIVLILFFVVLLLSKQ